MLTAYEGFMSSIQTTTTLHIGNLSPRVRTPAELQQCVNSLLVQLRLASAAGNPCTSCTIDAGGTSAVIQLRTAAETTNALALDGLTILGQVRKGRGGEEQNGYRSEGLCVLRSPADAVPSPSPTTVAITSTHTHMHPPRLRRRGA